MLTSTFKYILEVLILNKTFNRKKKRYLFVFVCNLENLTVKMQEKK